MHLCVPFLFNKEELSSRSVWSARDLSPLCLRIHLSMRFKHCFVFIDIREFVQRVVSKR